MDERSENKVFIGGLAPHTTEYTLAMHFSGYGQILESKIVTDKATNKSKGYGFVTFASPHAAAQAVANPSPFIDGKTCNCNLASAARQIPGAPGAPAGIPVIQAAQPRAAAAPAAAPALGARGEPYLDILRRQGEDLSPATVEAEVVKLYKESPSRALKWFLERAEVFRGTEDLAYYMTNLVALTREYREKGVIRDLPEKGSQEALNIQREHEDKQAQAMSAGAANEGEANEGEANEGEANEGEAMAVADADDGAAEPAAFPADE